MDISSLGRWFMGAGIVIFLIGGGFYLAGRFNIPLGRLPGDIRFESDKFSFFFPIVSSIIISLGLTLILNLLLRLWKR